MLGQPLRLPVLLAPTAFHRLAHPDGEVATARAAARGRHGHGASARSDHALEEVAAAAPARSGSSSTSTGTARCPRSSWQRAEAAGYRALVLTVDTPLLGRRERDVRNDFALPPGIAMANFERRWLSAAPRARRRSGLAQLRRRALRRVAVLGRARVAARR